VIGTEVFQFNKEERFGSNQRLDWTIVGRWIEAAHISQGTLMDELKDRTVEDYYYFSCNQNGDDEEHTKREKDKNLEKTKHFFSLLRSQLPFKKK
jgi:hypothetical protein